jgi:hypothetical protein
MTSKVWDKQIGGEHYQKFKIQPSKFVIENELLYPEGCAIKYIIRHRMKGKRQDLEKAIHFIEMIIERDYGDEAHKSQVFESKLKPESSGKNPQAVTSGISQKNSWGIVDEDS